jgi:hypothetical protein
VWSRILVEKLASPQLVKEFSSFYITRRLITAFKAPATCPCFKSLTFLNGSQHGNFYGELLASRPTSRLEGHVLSDVCAYLFDIFASTFIIGAVAPSPTWGRAMLWWHKLYIQINYFVFSKILTNGHRTIIVFSHKFNRIFLVWLYANIICNYTLKCNAGSSRRLYKLGPLWLWHRLLEWSYILHIKDCDELLRLKWPAEFSLTL